MKVGTDGVLLGSWTGLDGIDCSDAVGVQKKEEFNILDIGTGTGLIAMMLAQRLLSREGKPGDFIIDAIDIDEPSVVQAKKNIAASKFSGNIHVYHTGLEGFLKSSLEKHYNLIVSNPPFFSRSLKSGKNSRNMARHSDFSGLEAEKLIRAVCELMKPEGRFCLILPRKEGEFFISEATSKNLFCTRRTSVFPKPGKDILRYLLQFEFKQSEPIERSVYIETGKKPNDFSEGYRELTKDFYLNF